MIEKLYIENIGGIRGAELTFTRGLNVITGESGAGKSSVVRSLELLTGTRGGVRFIRAGEESGRVEAKFTGHNVMREVLSSGRSRARIDGVNAGEVKPLLAAAAGELLIHADRAGAGGKTERALGFRADDCFHNVSSSGALRGIILCNDDFHCTCLL